MRRAIAFLTPLGRASAPTPETLYWFPVVGALIGCAVGGIWRLASHVWAPLPAAAIAVVVDLLLTGLLHFDGLADAADGLVAPLSRERRLAAMADPAVGAFGVIAVAITLVLRVAAFDAIAPSVWAIGGLWCASRTSMVVVAYRLEYARPNGLVSDFLPGASRATGARVAATLSVIGGFALAVVLVTVGRGLHGALSLVAEEVAIVGVAFLAWRRLGGFTGDVLGAAGVVGETVGLLALAVHR